MAAQSYLHHIAKKTPFVNGNHKLLSCWTPGVSKFTAGSFYNFEQDNLPLYDLEERTYYNWQNAGFRSLQPESLHLLVSADAPSEVINCNSNIFRTLQEAVDALPDRISINTRITVASYGDLGSLKMAGITVDPARTLEIVNINCYDKPGVFPVDPYTGNGSTGAARGGAPYFYDALVSSIQTTNNQTSFGIYKGLRSFGSDEIGSNDLGCGGIADFFLRGDTSTGIGSLGFRPRVTNFDIDPYVASSIPGVLDPRVTDNYEAFVTPIPGRGKVAGNSLVGTQISRLSVGNVVFTYTGNSSENGNINQLGLNLELREENEVDADYILDYFTYDPSSFNQTTGQALFRGQPAGIASTHQNTDAAAVKATLYGNYLQLIDISNCTGKIHFTGFRLFGEQPFFAGGRTPLPIGIKIDGCPNIFIESCAVTDYALYGICLINSKVTFNRSLYVYRCYAKGTPGSPFAPYSEPQSVSITYGDPQNRRLSKPWLENIQSLDAPVNDESAGIYAVNSQIFIDDSETTRYNLLLANNLYNLDNPGASPYRSGMHNCRMISRCSTGIRLENSRLSGGQGPYIGRKLEDDLDLKDYLNVEGNANYGIHLIQSAFTFKGNTQVFHNTRGIRAENSRLVLDSFKIDNNHKYGLKLDDSLFTYGIVQTSSTGTPLLDFSDDQLYNGLNTKLYSYIFESNGQHIIATNSVIKPGPFLDPKPEYFGRFIFINAHGMDDNRSPLPGCVLTNTDADFIHAMSLRAGHAVGDTPSYMPGAHFYVNGGSNIKFLGSASAITCMASNQSETLTTLYRYVGLLAEDNSTVAFRGPTALYNAGVNVYVKNGSTVIFEPHKKDDGGLDLESFPLTDPKNHTMVEVHSLRACLVADNNSNIIMQDLGDYSNGWSLEQIEGTNYPTDDTAAYTSAGFFQFYPNPDAGGDVYADARFSDPLSERGTLRVMSEFGSNQYYWGFDRSTSDPYTYDDVTNGGVCIRAQNNSNVRVRNVNFPCGWWNTSGVIYDAYPVAGNDYCTKTFIWNISDNSTLHADHLSVSSSWPAAVGYFGPSAVWFSGTGGTLGPNYGAPSSTPDTSSLSVLDFYGLGLDNVWPLPNGTKTRYGFSVPQNQGPFRIYVGVDSAANTLQQDGYLGYARQLFAQGYNTSGNLSAIDSASSVYGKVIRETDDGGLAVSGYYYANEFVNIDPNCILLDESAANTFANAKNGAMGTSNRPQICTIYSSKIDSTGESKSSSTTHEGSGFRSSNIFDINSDI